MKIRFNGEVRNSAATTLADLLHEVGYDGASMATAVNGEFVAADERHRVMLQDGDDIDVLIPMQGG